jgi:hypothetical protein
MAEAPSPELPTSSSDARFAAGIVIPTRFRRIGQAGRKWDLPRSLPGYFADPDRQVLGASTKYVVRKTDPKAAQYLIKYAQKHGKRETLTEFFINQLGTALGLKMAHSGLLLADRVPTFVTRIFTGEDETLTHGSLMIEDCFKQAEAVDSRELDAIPKQTEQSFYTIDFVTEVLQRFCEGDFGEVFPPFIEMLVFDALTGSMDRHAQNWGVLGTVVKPFRYRFAPIFDSARALLWSLSEEQISELGPDLGVDEPATEKSLVPLLRHIDRARPCIGPLRNHPKVNKCNHFEFIDTLIRLYPIPVSKAIRKVSNGLGDKSARLMRSFPFRMGFTGRRKRLILRILNIRMQRLENILLRSIAERGTTESVKGMEISV